MITLEEFHRVQALLGQKGRPRPKSRSWAFTGLVRCGECGCAVTAEEKVNRFGSRYVYYHCTHRRRDYRCRQRSLELGQLEAQMEAFLRGLTIPERIHRWAIERLDRAHVEAAQANRLSRDSVHTAAAEVKKQLANLTRLKLRDLIPDDEFIAQRRELEHEELRLRQEAEHAVDAEARFEPAQVVISFRKNALVCFRHGGPEERRLVLDVVSSNLTLTDQKLAIEAKKPFRHNIETASHSSLCAVVEDVRTLMRDQVFLEDLKKMRTLLGKFMDSDHLAAA